MRLYKYEDIEKNMIPLSFSNDVWISSAALSLTVPTEDAYTQEEVISILEELKSKIEEIKPLKPTDDEDWQYGCFHGLELMQDKCLKLIQQKIDKLKEAKDGENNY